MGNIGSVDLEELKKAREELNRERGIENDPNMYKDYNPNRVKEESVSDESQEQSFVVNENTLNANSGNYESVTDFNANQSDTNVENLGNYTENLTTQNYEQNSNSENRTQSFDEDERILNFDEKPEQGLDLRRFEVNVPTHEEQSENLSVENSQSFENNASSANLEKVDEQELAPQTQSMSKEEVQSALQEESGAALNEETYEEDNDDEDDDFDIDDFFNKIIGEGANSLSEEDLENADDDIDDESSSEENLNEDSSSVENVATEPISDLSVSEVSDNFSEQKNDTYEESSDFVENKQEQIIEDKSQEQKFDSVEEDEDKNFDVYDNFAEFEVKGYQNYQTQHENSVTENVASEKPEQSSETFVSNDNDEEKESSAEDEQESKFEKFFAEESVEDENHTESDSSEEFDISSDKENEKDSDSNFDLNDYLSTTNDLSEENSQEEYKQEENLEDEEITSQNVQDENQQEQENAIDADETEVSETVQEQAQIEDEDLKAEEISEENILENENPQEISLPEIKEDDAVELEKETVQNLEEPESEDASEIEPEVQAETQIENDVNAENFNDYEHIYEDVQNIGSISENKVEEKKNEVSDDLFEKIKDYKFVDVLESEEFKSSEKLSYLFGKDSNDRLMFMNMRDMFNTVMFGLNEKVMFEHISSMLLSLALKNTINDINFVICDSKLESDYEVFNKSSYMFFNRVAKTNREILDTLVELESELDQRYNTLVGVGARSIEHYNKFAAEADISAMPYIVLVLNNYTRASSMVLGEQINICLSNILKLGRIVGIYAVVVAYENIENAEINFNLPGRLAYKTENAEISEFEVGSNDATKLASDDEFVYTSVKADEVFHLKTPRLGVNEVNLIIENLEN